MHSPSKRSWIPHLLAAIAFLTVTVVPVQAQTATTATFSIPGHPLGGMLQAGDGNFYSLSPGGLTCENDPNQFCSFIYQITPNGTVSVFHAFPPVPTSASNGGVNSDGYFPVALVVGTDGNFYGACQAGGPGGAGTIFQITLAGQLTVLKSFGVTGNNADPGSTPNAMIQGADGNFYFTNGLGVYGLTLSGSLSTIFTFPSDGSKGNNSTSIMQGGDGNFYLTLFNAPVIAGATANYGAIAQLTLGGQLTIVHSFATDRSEGTQHGGPLVQASDGNLYGVAKVVNTIVNMPTTGLAYKVSPGGAFTFLHSFAGPIFDNWDSGLFLGSDGNIYGTTLQGGDPASVANCAPRGCGTVYQMTPSGTVTTLHMFEGGVATSNIVSENPQVDGAGPASPLVQGPGGIFYGAAVGSAPKGSPTAFTVTLNPAIPAPVQLTFDKTTVGTNSPAKLTWRVLNAFSTTAQQCGAVVQGGSGAGAGWSGKQTGSLVNGVYTGTATIKPTQPGNYTYGLVCGGKEAGFATLKAVNGFQITTSVLPQGQVNKKYLVPINVIGDTSPDTWSATNVPAGLEVNVGTGEVIGTPIQFGDYVLSVTVTDSATPAHQATAPVSLKIISGLKIQTTTLQKATVDAQYAQTLKATGGYSPLLVNGQIPYTWSITSGSLPNGLSMNSSGKISGTPTVTGSFPITFQAQDGESNPATDTATLTLKVVPTVQIAAVEFTQAIQQYQTLDDLNTSLTSNSEPPVPIISNKPGVMRVYFTKLKDTTDVVLKVSGAIVGQKAMSLPPDCDPSDARVHNQHCPSMDFYFTPPSGAWSTILTLEDNTQTQLEQETLGITSRDTLALNLKGVWICTVPFQPSSCQDPSVLLGLTGVMSTILPTSSVPTPTILPLRITRNPNLYTNPDLWLDRATTKVGSYYSPADAADDAAANQRTDYVGVYDHTIIETGVGEIGGHGIFLPNSTTRMGVVNTPWTLAHEVGHTLSLLHTNLSNPLALGTPQTPPGCWNIAEDPGTYWPYPDNRVQSTTGDEYGFDVPNGNVVHPDVGAFGRDNNAYELMGYCVSRWISPLNYKRALLYVNGGATPAPSIVRGRTLAQEPGLHSSPRLAAVSFAQGFFWNVSGSIPASGITLDPIFTANMLGTSDAGSGTYSIQELNSSGQVLFKRQFTPAQNSTETVNGDFTGDPHFSEIVPATPGTASIAVLDPTGNTLTTVAMTGAPPTVAFTVPAAGFVGSGQQTVSWTATSSTATKFTSRIFYSTDSGTTWQPIEDTTDLSLILDFNTLRGSSTALLRVDVTDGVNTGSATSVPFSVPKKLPTTIVINTPLDGAVRVSADPVYLSGAAFDPDDGVLAGKALQWSSDVQGNLGTGSPLSINLQPGKHTITLTATDSDGNSLTATTHITMGGAAPVVTLSVSNASTCAAAVINATPGNLGANLTAVAYSLDGGATYTAIPLAMLPFTVRVTGSGSANVAALAVDASGQVGAQSLVVNASASCGTTTTLVSSQNPSLVGQSVTFTATVAPASGTAVPTGTITFLDGATPLGSAVPLDNTGKATLVLSTLTQGNHSITASYIGDTNFTASTSSTLTQVVNVPAKTSTTTAVVSSPNPSTVGQSVTVMATVMPASGTAVPTGTITFLDGTTPLGSAATLDNTGKATLTISTLTQGSHNITATYSGDANFGGSTSTALSQVVNAPAKTNTATALASSPNPSTSGQAVTFSATVTPASGNSAPTGTVTFFEGTTQLGSPVTLDSTGKTSMNTSTLSAGSHSITAQYAGDSNFAASTSAALTQTVTATDFSFTLSQGTATIQAGQTATFVVQMNATGAAQTVSLTCTGAPAAASCTAPATVSVTPGTAATVTVGVTTTARGAVFVPETPRTRPPFGWPRLIWVALLVLLALLASKRRSAASALAPARLRLAPRLAVVLLLAALVSTVAVLGGCAGANRSQGTPPGISTLTLTGTANGVSHSTQLTLTVQ